MYENVPFEYFSKATNVDLLLVLVKPIQIAKFLDHVLLKSTLT